MKSYNLLENILFWPTFLSDKSLNNFLKGKTVLISGASYGIGEALAMRLSSSGCRLILVARTEEKLLEVQKKVQENGGDADIFAADLTVEAGLDKLIAYISSKPKGIDIFINNAGKSIRRSIYDSLDRFHDFQRTMALNYFAPVKLLLFLIPILEKNKGQIINVSAVNVLMVPAPKWAAYQASKTAFDQWMRSVSPELEVKGISTTAIYLPLVRTRMIEPTAAYSKMPAMQPEHVARIIAKSIYTKRRISIPWWAMFGILGSVIFRGLWEWAVPINLKNK